MTDHNTSGVSRRSIAKGAAWAAPVIAVAATAPFASASEPPEPPEPQPLQGTSCKTGGSSGETDKAFYGQFSVTNFTGQTLTYTISTFETSNRKKLADIQVMPTTRDVWAATDNGTFTVSSGGTYTFYIRGGNTNSGNDSFTMFYSVAGYNGQFDSDLNYVSMPVCCSSADLCPPGSGAYVPPTSSAATTQKTSAPTSSSAAPSSATEQAAPTTQSAAPASETTVAPATESAVATEAPASSSN